MPKIPNCGNGPHQLLRIGPIRIRDAAGKQYLLGSVELAVFNLTGQRVATLVDGVRNAGTYTVGWDGRDNSGRGLASGIYLYRLRTGQQVQSRKLLLLQ